MRNIFPDLSLPNLAPRSVECQADKINEYYLQLIFLPFFTFAHFFPACVYYRRDGTKYAIVLALAAAEVIMGPTLGPKLLTEKILKEAIILNTWILHETEAFICKIQALIEQHNFSNVDWKPPQIGSGP